MHAPLTSSFPPSPAYTFAPPPRLCLLLPAGPLHRSACVRGTKVAVDLGCNRLGEDPRGDGDASGVAALAAALASHHGLTSLNLRDNRLGCARARRTLKGPKKEA